MKNKIILTLIFVSVILFGFTTNASALEITTINATQSNDVITVSGETEDGMLAASVFVFDMSGNNVVATKTIPVDNNSYSTTFSLSEGNYVIKVADYDGGNFKEITLTSSKSNPKTGDNMLIYVIIGILSVVGLSGILIYFKKQNT